MNITVNSTALVQELRLLNHVVPAKPTLPILGNLLLRAEMETLTFSATDLEVSFKTSCRASVTEPGAMTIPAKRLLDLVEQMPDGDVQIVADKSFVRILSGAFKSRLQTMPVDDYPSLPLAEGERSSFSTSQLHTMIHRVRYAISDKTKYMISGALLTVDKATALVATDGKRLAIAAAPLTPGPKRNVTLPSATLDALLALFTDEQLEFSHSARHLFFQTGDRLLVSRMIDGDFPKYERIIPKHNDKRAVIDRTQFMAALKRVSLLSEQNQAVFLSFEPSALHMTSSSADAGEAFERVNVKYDGPAIKLCISWRYVLDFLEAATNGTTTLDFKDSSTPLLMTDGADFVNVVICMRIT